MKDMQCQKFEPGARSKCSFCGKMWMHHSHPEPKINKDLIIPPMMDILEPITKSFDLKSLQILDPLDIPKSAPKPTPITTRISGSIARASNEIMLNEMLSIIFPDGREVNGEELSLRLHVAFGTLKKYGFGTQPPK